MQCHTRDRSEVEWILIERGQDEFQHRNIPIRGQDLSNATAINNDC